MLIYFQAALSPPTGVLRLDSLDSLSADGNETYTVADGLFPDDEEGWDTDLEIDGTVEEFVKTITALFFNNAKMQLCPLLNDLAYFYVNQPFDQATSNVLPTLLKKCDYLATF